MNDDPEVARQARNAVICGRVHGLWREGCDTVRIAEETALAEPEVCRILHAWFDLRHFAKAGQMRARA